MLRLTNARPRKEQSDENEVHVQQLENGAVRIMCERDPKTLCEVSACDEDHMALCDYPVADGKSVTSECARFTELAPGTTSITALIIARQRREEKDQG